MAYELHVWGPAFGFPSIDAACNAAIVYLKTALPADKWVAVIDHSPPNPLLNGTFPSLRIGSEWIYGFDAIVARLQNDGYTLVHAEPQGEAEARGAAEKQTLAVHIAANAQPLLAAHFYTTHKNWTNVTRTTWTRVLPTHANYTVVPVLYERARTIAASAGLSSGIEGDDDLPPASDPSTQAQLQAKGQLDTGSPSLLFARSRQTVQQAVNARQSATRFRLEALIDDLLELLEKTVSKTNEASIPEIDAVAYGYLAPLLYDEMPVTWIPKLMREKYPNTCRYIDGLEKLYFPDGQVDTQLAMSSPVLIEGSKTTSSIPRSLPYRRAPPPSYLACAGNLLRSLSYHIISPASQRMLLYDTDLRSRLPLIIGTALPLLGGFAYLAYRFATFRTGPDHVFGRGRPRLAGLGAAGAALSVFGQSQTYPDQATLGMDGVDIVGLGGSGAIGK